MDQYFSQTLEELEEWICFIEKDLENVKRVIETIDEEDVDAEFMVHAKAETVEESAENTGVNPESIVKTLVFIAGSEPVAILCPGDSRVDEQELEDMTGDEVRMAGSDEVTEATGYRVGGVSPFDLDIPVYMEESILTKDNVKPAAGSRVVGVTIDPEDLKEVADAETADVAE